MQHRPALQNRQLTVIVFGEVGFRTRKVLYYQREVHGLAIEYGNAVALQQGPAQLVATIRTL